MTCKNVCHGLKYSRDDSRAMLKVRISFVSNVFWVFESKWINSSSELLSDKLQLVGQL